MVHKDLSDIETQWKILGGKKIQIPWRQVILKEVIVFTET